VWLLTLPDEAQAHIVGQIQYSARLPIEWWEERHEYKRLTGELANLEALRFVVPEKVRRGQPAKEDHYRILGFSDLSKLEFTMLCGFQKLTGNWDYEEYGLIANDRRQEVLENRKKYSHFSNWLIDDE